MRCQSCQSDNRDTARFCAQCGVTLAVTCSSCANVLPPGARFCDACGTPAAPGVAGATTAPSTPPAGPAGAPPPHLAREILRSRHAIEGERKQVTVLFADIKGSTALIEGLDPEDAVRLMQPTLRAMMDAVHRFEGTVNRVQGDGIMALFGAPIAHEDHAVRACHAALAMQTTADGADALPVRVGLNTGEVVVRAINNDLTVEYEADGPAVHLAARMEQMAEPGSILLTADTYRLAQGLVMVDSLGPKPVKGMSGDVSVFVLRGVRSGVTRMEARSGGALSPFVGRESELAALERALARAGDHHGQVVTISGETGVGKSRLVREFADAAGAKGWTVRVTGGDPLATTSSYQPVVHLLKSLFDVDDDDDATKVAAKTSEAVLALDPGLASIIAPLHAVMGVPVEDGAWIVLSPEERRRRIIEAICALTLTRAKALRLLMVFEDLHWLDAETRAVLDALVDGLGGTRMMLLTTHRPEYSDTWGAKSYYTRLRVDPLETLTADEFLAHTLGRDPGLETLKRLLVERTHGVPFFLEESIRALVETKHLAGDAGAYTLTTEVDQLEVPATVQVVLAARIDRLPTAHKEVLQIAAVIGRHVSLSVLESVAGMPTTDLLGTLTELQRSEFLFLTASVPESIYAFKHALTQEVAYASLLHEVRRRIHARLVEVTEARYVARLDEHLAVLGRHALDAELWDKADAYLGRAAERAAERSAYYEVIRLLDQQLVALGHLARTPEVVERTFDTHLGLRTAYGATGNVPRMVEHIRQARAIQGQVRDTLHAAYVDIYAASIIDLYEDIDERLEATHAVLDAAGDANNVALGALATFGTGLFNAFAGRYEAAAEATASPLADEDGERRHDRFGMTGTWTVLMLSVHAICRAQQGRHDDARHASAIATAIAEETCRPFDTGVTCWTAGALGLWRGDLAGCVDTLSRGHAVCASQSVGILMPNLAPTLAYALHLEGRDDEAREILGPWQEAAEGAPTFWFHAWGAAFTGLAGMAVGEPAAALRTMRRWQRLVATHGLTGIEPAVERVLQACRLAAGEGTPTEAGSGLSRALQLADTLGAAPEAAHCHLALGRLALEQGRAEEATARIADARTRFEQLHMPLWAHEARRLEP